MVTTQGLGLPWGSVLASVRGDRAAQYGNLLELSFTAVTKVTIVVRNAML